MCTKYCVPQISTQLKSTAQNTLDLNRTDINPQLQRVEAPRRRPPRARPLPLPRAGFESDQNQKSDAAADAESPAQWPPTPPPRDGLRRHFPAERPPTPLPGPAPRRARVRRPALPGPASDAAASGSGARLRLRPPGRPRRSALFFSTLDSRMPPSPASVLELLRAAVNRSRAGRRGPQPRDALPSGRRDARALRLVPASRARGPEARAQVGYRRC